MDLLALAHLKWLSCIVIFFPLSNAQSASDFEYCYGADYTEDIGNSFIGCAGVNMNVTITACDSEYQADLEFAIANGLYQTCLNPRCVFSNLEVAFFWNITTSCYGEKLNTGSEEYCWESRFNTFYSSGTLAMFLSALCYSTAIPTEVPTSYPSAFPTQWCDGKEFNDTIGEDFLTCASNLVDGVTLETCDPDDQDDLYFGIANELYYRCEEPYCIYASSDIAFFWSDASECYELQYSDTNGDCWETIRYSYYYLSGDLAEDLELICFDTAGPTLTPTETPTSSPTLHPTDAPTTYPTLYPTRTPTMHPTQAPTMAPSQTPTVTPTMTPSNTPTSMGMNTPTNVPTNTPTNVPTETPTPRPTMPWVERTSDASSFFVSADVSCITLNQVGGTLEPLGRVVNVTGQKIGIDSYGYSSMNMAGLEVDGFRIQWLVVLPERREELVEMIKAGNMTDALIQEFRTEFNTSNCSIIVENMSAKSLMEALPQRKADYHLLPWICGMTIIVLCILCVILWFTHRKWDEDSKTPDDFPYEEHQDISAGTTAGTTTVIGGAGSKSKSVSFTSVVPANNEGSNRKKAIQGRGGNEVTELIASRGVML